MGTCSSLIAGHLTACLYAQVCYTPFSAHSLHPSQLQLSNSLLIHFLTLISSHPAVPSPDVVTAGEGGRGWEMGYKNCHANQHEHWYVYTSYNAMYHK